MKTFIKKLGQKRSSYLIGIALFLLVILLLPQPAWAIESGIMGTLISWVGSAMLLLVNFLGTWLLLPLINLVIWIFSYNSFLSSNAVAVGWPLVRDLSNMFFVVILLFIAFATILNISSYSYKTTFFKLIMMAILVNFSKTIMGFFIDFSQVIMLTFVSAFRDAAAVNLIHAFGIRDMLKLNPNSENFSNVETVGVVILAVILLVVAIGLMLAFAVVLLWRILTLWVLIILSPLAFLLSSIPAGQKYASEIWSKFTEQLVTGIALAFFTWLFFSVLAAGYSTDQQKVDNNSILTGNNPGAGLTANQSASIAGTNPISTDIDWERLYTFIIAIALLFLALEYAQKAGGHAGTMAGKISGHATGLLSKTARLGGVVGLGGLGFSREKLEGRLGVSLSPKKWKEGWEEGKHIRQQRRQQVMIRKASQRGGILGSLGTPGHFFAERWGWDLGAQVAKEGFAGGKVSAKVGMYNDIRGKMNDLNSIKDTVAGHLGQERWAKFNTLRGKENKTEQEKEEFEELSNSANEFLRDPSNFSKDHQKVIADSNINNLDDLDANNLKLGDDLVEAAKAVRSIKGAVNYDLQKALRNDYNSEKREMTSNQWQEHVAYFEDAQHLGDLPKAGGALLKATEDGNLNEFLNQFGYAAGGSGLQQFILRELIGSKGMTDQERRDYDKEYGKRYGTIDHTHGMGMSMTQGVLLGTDVSFTAERIGHWQSGRITSGNPDGSSGFQSYGAQQAEIAGETGKIAGNKILQSWNRLFGYREEAIDNRTYRTNPDRDSLVEAGMLSRFYRNMSEMVYSYGRGQMTPSFVENMAKDQNYVLWRRVIDRMPEGAKKEEAIRDLNGFRELGLQSLRAKGYPNDVAEREKWRAKKMDGEDGHIAEVFKALGINFNTERDTYENLKKKYATEMSTFNGEGKKTVLVKGTDVTIDDAVKKVADTGDSTSSASDATVPPKTHFDELSNLQEQRRAKQEEIIDVKAKGLGDEEVKSLEKERDSLDSRINTTAQLLNQGELIQAINSLKQEIIKAGSGTAEASNFDTQRSAFVKKLVGPTIKLAVDNISQGKKSDWLEGAAGKVEFVRLLKKEFKKVSQSNKDLLPFLDEELGKNFRKISEGIVEDNEFEAFMKNYK